jgi:hypothetical protein
MGLLQELLVRNKRYRYLDKRNTAISDGASFKELLVVTNSYDFRWKLLQG